MDEEVEVPPVETFDKDTWNSMDEETQERYLKQLPVPDAKTYRDFHKFMAKQSEKMSKDSKTKAFFETYIKHAGMTMKKGQSTGKRVRLSVTASASRLVSVTDSRDRVCPRS